MRDLAGRSPTILIVDDQPDIRLMCRVNLNLEGYKVIEAGDGDVGLAAAREHRPDLVLLDVMMPVMDGWQVIDALKADPETAPIPVVMLTARVQHADEVRGWTSGAADYLSKPFNPSTLTQVVGRAILNVNVDQRRAQALAKLSIL